MVNKINNSFSAVQSSFLPWIGYFTMMQCCKKFVVIDDVQYDKNGWRNRNRIKLNEGYSWVTVPIISKRKSKQRINEVEIEYSQKWQSKMLSKIESSYSSSPYFDEIFSLIARALEKNFQYLNELNIDLIIALQNLLKINTEIFFSSDISISNNKQERIIGYAKKLGTTNYISGLAAKNYIDCDFFVKNKIDIHWYKYDSNLVYAQKGKIFLPNLSIIDLLMNVEKNEVLQFMDKINSFWETT